MKVRNSNFNIGPRFETLQKRHNDFRTKMIFFLNSNFKQNFSRFELFILYIPRGKSYLRSFTIAQDLERSDKFLIRSCEN
jgi:hypothetical protein